MILWILLFGMFNTTPIPTTPIVLNKPDITLEKTEIYTCTTEETQALNEFMNGCEAKRESCFIVGQRLFCTSHDVVYYRTIINGIVLRSEYIYCTQSKSPSELIKCEIG